MDAGGKNRVSKSNWIPSSPMAGSPREAVYRKGESIHKLSASTPPADPPPQAHHGTAGAQPPTTAMPHASISATTPTSWRPGQQNEKGACLKKKGGEHRGGQSFHKLPKA